MKKEINLKKKISGKDLEKVKFIVLENFDNDSIEMKVYKGKKMGNHDWKPFVLMGWITIGISFIIGLLLGLLIGVN